MAVTLYVGPDTIRWFQAELWKDVRNLEVCVTTSPARLRRYSDNVTSIKQDLEAIEYVQSRVPTVLLPKILGYSHEYLELEYVEGTRAFNLLVDLRDVYRETNEPRAHELACSLLLKLNSDLSQIQEGAAEYAQSLAASPYPYKSKVHGAIALVASALGLSPINAEISDDINRLTEIVGPDCRCPFRDASPKNSIVALPQLSLGRFSQREERLQKILRLLREGDLLDTAVSSRLYHLDFSGFHHLCPECDDRISLNYHECVAWLHDCRERFLQPQDSNLFVATAIFRCVRLALRKLGYRLLHAKTHRIRYQYENEAYYIKLMNGWICNLAERNVICGERWQELNRIFLEACRVQVSTDYFDQYAERSARPAYSDVFPD